MSWTNVIGLLAILAPIIWAVCQHYSNLKQERQIKEFDNYHRLIKELVQPEKSDERMYVDRQAAIIYELRNFKRYYPITYRTLKGLEEKWAENNVYPRLIEEIQLAITFLENNVTKKELSK